MISYSYVDRFTCPRIVSSISHLIYTVVFFGLNCIGLASNGIWIDYAVFTGLMVVIIHRQTDRQTSHARCVICNNRPHLAVLTSLAVLAMLARNYWAREMAVLMTRVCLNDRRSATRCRKCSKCASVWQRRTATRSIDWPTRWTRRWRSAVSGVTTRWDATDWKSSRHVTSCPTVHHCSSIETGCVNLSLPRTPSPNEGRVPGAVLVQNFWRGGGWAPGQDHKLQSPNGV